MRLPRRNGLGRQALSLPNLITYVRILAVPAILAVMQYDSPRNAFIAALIFGFASGTDALDGWLARKYNQISVIGKLLDPLADKLIVTGALVMLSDGWYLVPARSLQVPLGGHRAGKFPSYWFLVPFDQLGLQLGLGVRVLCRLLADGGPSRGARARAGGGYGKGLTGPEGRCTVRRTSRE